MSNSKTKPSIYEVILSQLRIAVETLGGWADRHPGFQDIDTNEQVSHIDALCRVIGQVEIPEEQQSIFIYTLLVLSNNCPIVPGHIQAKELLCLTGLDIAKTGSKELKNLSVVLKVLDENQNTKDNWKRTYYKTISIGSNELRGSEDIKKLRKLRNNNPNFFELILFRFKEEDRIMIIFYSENITFNGKAVDKYQIIMDLQYRQNESSLSIGDIQYKLQINPA